MDTVDTSATTGARCRCCMAPSAAAKDLTSEYDWMGEKEVYSDMLLESFDIKLRRVESAGWKICEVCITRLRDSSNFKKQVLYSEKCLLKTARGGGDASVLEAREDTTEIVEDTTEVGEDTIEIVEDTTEAGEDTIEIREDTIEAAENIPEVMKSEVGSEASDSDEFETHYLDDDEDLDEEEKVSVKSEHVASTSEVSNDEDAPLCSLTTTVKCAAPIQTVAALTAKWPKLTIKPLTAKATVKTFASRVDPQYALSKPIPIKIDEAALQRKPLDASRLTVGKNVSAPLQGSKTTVKATRHKMISLSAREMKLNTSLSSPKITAKPSVSSPKIIVKPSVSSPKIIVKPSVSSPKIIVKPSVSSPKIIVKPSVSSPKIIVKPSAETAVKGNVTEEDTTIAPSDENEQINNSTNITEPAEKSTDRLMKVNAINILQWSNVIPFSWNVVLGFNCFYCEMPFANIEELKAHTRYVHDPTDAEQIVMKLKPETYVKVDIVVMNCKLCSQHFDDMEALKTHLEDDHGKVFEKEANLGVLPYRLDENRFSCALCQEICLSFRTLLCHVHKHFQNYICYRCGEGFMTNLLYATHLKKHNGFICSSCGEKFNLASSLASHRLDLHTPNKLQCPYCPEKFPDKLRREQHCIKIHKAKEHKCDVCSRMFPTKQGLGRHKRRMHVKEVNYICDVCNKGFFSKVQCTDHMLVHVEERPYECKYCKRAFKRKRELAIHIRLHKSDKKYVCSECNRAYVQIANLNKHMKSHFKDTVTTRKSGAISTLSNVKKTKNQLPYRLMKLNSVSILECSNVIPFQWNASVGFHCFYCDLSFTETEELKEHTRDAHSPIEAEQIVMKLKPEKYINVDIVDIICKLCSEPFNDLETLMRHLEDEHEKVFYREATLGVLPFRLVGSTLTCVMCAKICPTLAALNDHVSEHFPDYMCEKCGEQFMTAQFYNTHMNKHIGFVCSTCGATFNSQSRLNAHRLDVHTPKRFQCSYCPEKFPDKQRREQHCIKIHKAKEYKCDVCNGMFPTKQGLGRHKRRMHAKEVNHVCKLCKKGFFSKEQYNDHMSVHVDARPYGCTYCKRLFKRKRELAIHVRIHKNDKRFVCPKCDKGFVQNGSLKCHMKAHHKDAESPQSSESE